MNKIKVTKWRPFAGSKVRKQGLGLSRDTKEFLNAWPKGAIVKVENTTGDKQWERL